MNTKIQEIGSFDDLFSYDLRLKINQNNQEVTVETTKKY